MKIETEKLKYFAYGILTKKYTYISLAYYALSLVIWAILAIGLTLLVGAGIAFAVILIGFLLLFIAQYLVEQFGRMEKILQKICFKEKYKPINKKTSIHLIKKYFFTVKIYKNWLFHIQKIFLIHILFIPLLILLFYTFQSFIVPFVYIFADSQTQIYVGSIFTFTEILVDSWGIILLQLMSGYFTLLLSVHIFVSFAKIQQLMRRKLL